MDLRRIDFIPELPSPPLMANPSAQKTKISLRTKASKEGMGMIRPGTGLVNAAEDQPENSTRQYRRRHRP